MLACRILCVTFAFAASVSAAFAATGPMAVPQPLVEPIINGLPGVTDIATDSSGRIFVSTAAQVRIYGKSARGSYVALKSLADPDLTSEMGGLKKYNNYMPAALAVDGSGVLYEVQADTPFAQIRRFSFDDATDGWNELPIVSLDSPPLSPFPTGLAVDASHNIYVADSLGVHEYSPSEVSYIRKADITTTSANKVAVDKAGNLFVADASTVKKFVAQGNVFAAPVVIANITAAYLAVDAAGSVYATDSSSTIVRKYAFDGSSYAAATDISASSPLGRPTAIRVDDQGNVFVMDAAAFILCEFAPSAAGYQRNDLVSAGNLEGADLIAVDVAGNVYVSDRVDAGGVHKYAPTSTGYVALPNVVPPDVYLPSGLAVDGAGNVFTTETTGKGLHGYSPNGGTYVHKSIATDSTFSSVAIDKAGNLYVADFDNGAVRKYAPSAQGYTRVADVGAGLQSRAITSIAVSASGVVYALANGNLYQFTPNGSSYEMTRTVQQYADSVAVDPQGTVYLTSTINGNLSIASLGSGNTGQANVMVANVAAWFSAPGGVAFDASGSLYLVDAGDDRVLMAKSVAGSSATRVVAPSAAPFASLFNAIARVDGYQPQGTVTFYDGDTLICNTVAISANGDSPNTATAACTYSTAVAGAHTIRAVYSGDGNNTVSSGQTETDFVASSTLTVSSNVSIGRVKQSITFSAHLNSAYPPTGTVTVVPDGSMACIDLPLDSAGTATCEGSFNAAGNITITATYSGDPYNSASSATFTQGVVDNSGFNAHQHGLTGSWYDPNSSGQGLLFEIYPNLVKTGQGVFAAGWFTFGTALDPGPRWFTLQGLIDDGADAAALAIYSSVGGNFNAGPKISAQQVGTATLLFSDCAHAVLQYSFSGGGPAGSINLVRLDANATCATTGDAGTASQDYLLSGAWYSPATSGQGFFFDVSTTQSTLFAAWYSYLPNGAANPGAQSQQWFSVQTNAFAPGQRAATSVPIYAVSGGQFASSSPIVRSQVGSADVTFSNCRQAKITYSFTAGANSGRSGSIDLQRVVTAPAGCSP